MVNFSSEPLLVVAEIGMLMDRLLQLELIWLVSLLCSVDMFIQHFFRLLSERSDLTNRGYNR